jgi:hypothetical protein
MHKASLTPGFARMTVMRDPNTSIYILGEIRISNPNVYFTISRVLNCTVIEIGYNKLNPLHYATGMYIILTKRSTSGFQPEPLQIIHKYRTCLIVEWRAFLPRTREAPASNLGHETDYPYWCLSSRFFVHLSKFRDITSNYVATAHFHLNYKGKAIPVTRRGAT